ncbi:hypothetical protein OGAPHI_002297 [Ogataea philodendri]|uniref:Protein-serine/threonine kinase n=1 Tax=Ogataea philodendri TaxID=1378263 RepID=A0A9P8PA88_9ASCO|nr:uncharacterized protein OGAPHI_002297 [Ogataea philodendri]KAH3668543.1 hypothetical protein OGAPHI_002297 [Ogataea philodendri]
MTRRIKVTDVSSKVDSLSPFRSQSISLLNKQHFYQNSILLGWSERNAHPVTLRHLANFGKRLTKEKLISSANFVRTELPVRLSLKIRELQSLDFDVINNHHINQVYQSYYHCFNAFRRMGRIETFEENEKFCEFLRKVLNDHLLVLPHLMMGALEVSILQKMPQDQLDEFMSSMLRSRISRRVIIEQHTSLSDSFKDQDEDLHRPSNYIGAAFQYISAHEQLITCKDIVSSFLQSIYPNLRMPELIIIGDDVKFQFLTNHLNYIYAEILRNSLKSTIQTFLRRNSHCTAAELRTLKPPPIVVEIVQTKNSMTFKFSDQGGGMSSEKLSKVWSFGKSLTLAEQYFSNFNRLPGLNFDFTSPVVDQSDTELHGLSGMIHNIGQMETSNNHRQNSVLSSLVRRPFEFTLGISMPMCKVYTDYWNGDLDMKSIEGYGTDVFLQLKKLGNADKPQLDKA